MTRVATRGNRNCKLSDEDQQRLNTLWEFAAVLERYLGALPQVVSWRGIVEDKDNFLTACHDAAAIQPELHLREMRLLSPSDPVLRDTFSSGIGTEMGAMLTRGGVVRRVLQIIVRSYKRRRVSDVGELITGVISSLQLLADTAEKVDSLRVCEIRSESGSSIRVISGRSLRKKIREAVATLQQHVEVLTYIQQSIAKLSVIVYKREGPEEEPRRIHLQASVQETDALRMKGRLPENAESYTSVASRIGS